MFGLSMQEAVAYITPAVGRRHWRLVINEDHVWTADSREARIVPAVAGEVGRNLLLSGPKNKAYTRLSLRGEISSGPALGSALRGYTWTEVLQLRQCTPRPLFLSPVLKSLPRLQQLELECRLGGGGVADLARALGCVPHLRSLSLYDTDLGETGFSELARHLHEAPALESLCILDEHICPRDLRRGARAVRPAGLVSVVLDLPNLETETLIDAIRFAGSQPRLRSCSIRSPGSPRSAPPRIDGTTHRAMRAVVDRRFHIQVLNTHDSIPAPVPHLREAAIAYRASYASPVLPPELLVPAVLDAYDVDEPTLRCCDAFLDALGQ